MKKLIIFSAIFFLVGILAGYGFFYFYASKTSASQSSDLYPIRLNNSSYKFINPLLAYVIPAANEDAKWADLKNTISDIIASYKPKGIDTASVYLSGLNQGRWIGVNEDQTYPPASMFKVVIMIGWLKAAEENPSILNQRLVYTRDDAKNTLDGFTTLKVGESYLVNDLINKMIIDSDNGAETILLLNADQNFFNSLFGTLGIPGISKGTFYVSPHQYSLFFRIIYNATFLNANLSEKALSILSKTTYNDGIVAGVPAGTVVAHKYGEYINHQDSKDLELHDCGIVYASKRPYFLCVMTKGDNLDASASLIKDISKFVYDAINK